MRKFIRNNEGSVLVFTALFLVMLLGFGALAVDISMMYTAKNQLQAAVDAAALAGASGLLLSQGEASSRATSFASVNNCLGTPVNPVTVGFPTAQRIRVDATRNANLFLAGVLGINTGQVTAHAVAQVGDLIGTRQVQPWLIPDIPYDAWDPNGSAPPTIVNLKIGESKSDIGSLSSFFFCGTFPPISRLPEYDAIWPCPGDAETGGAVYEDNIKYGTQYDIFKGDSVLTEPGNNVGTTKAGVDYCMATGRIEVVVPLFQYYDDAGNVIDYDTGRKPRIISDFGLFHLLGIQNGKDVVGYFVKKTIPGHMGGNPTSMLTAIRLVE